MEAGEGVNLSFIFKRQPKDKILSKIAQLVGEAFNATGSLAALPDSASPESLQKALEEVSGTFERSALELRRLCEKHAPGVGGYGNRPAIPRMEVDGFVEQFGYGWLHIQLHTLLPHCRYRPAEWLSDTIRCLLDDYEEGGSKLPFFQQAMLVIDEYCGVDICVTANKMESRRTCSAGNAGIRTWMRDLPLSLSS